MTPLVRFDRHGRVGWLTLNRPEKLNAVNKSLAQAMTLTDYRTKVAELDIALRDMPPPPAESNACHIIDVALRDAVRNYQEAEKHLVKAIPDTKMMQRLKDDERAAYVQRLKSENGYKENCWQSAIKSTIKASDMLKKYEGN